MHPDATQPATTETVSPARQCGGRLRVRLRAVVYLALAATIVAAGWSLTPDPAGHGTHEQWRLPPCSFMMRSGYPCPSCGMTTAVAAASQGRLLTAWSAQPFGLMLVIAAVAMAAVAAVELLRGKAVGTLLRPRLAWALILAGGVLFGWAWKLGAGILAGRFPMHM